MDSHPTFSSSLRRAALELMARIQNSVSQICLEPTRRCITLLPIWARSSQRRSFWKPRSNSAVGSTRPTLFSALSAHSPRLLRLKAFEPRVRRKKTMRIQKFVVLLATVLTCALAVTAQSKPKLTLDEFFNSVSFPALEISPTAIPSSSSPSAPTGTSRSSARISGSIATTPSLLR